MVRPTGGSSSPRRAATSAQELMRSVGKQIFGDDFSGGPVAASKAEYNKITDIMFDDIKNGVSKLFRTVFTTFLMETDEPIV